MFRYRSEVDLPARCSGESTAGLPGPVHEERSRSWLAIAAITAALAALALLGAPAAEPKPTRLDLAVRVPPPRPIVATVPRPGGRLLRVAFATMISPPDTQTSYGRLAGYLAARVGARPEIVQRGSYGEVNELLAGDTLSLAFICSGAYPQAHDQYGARPLVVPVIGGRATYHSYILVPRLAKASSLSQLAGARFALVDPRSLTGRLYLLDRLRELRLPALAVPEQVVWTRSHDRSIHLVARELVDAAPVDSLVWERLAQTEPALTGGTRVIERSPAFPAPPFVVPASCPPQLERRLRGTLINMHADAAGLAILRELGIDRFEGALDMSYDVVRALRQRMVDGGQAEFFDPHARPVPAGGRPDTRNFEPRLQPGGR